jgi:hypothetical protein
MLNKIFLSDDFRVFIINFSSCEKKKKEPLFPEPWPALNTCYLLFSNDKDCRKSYGDILSKLIIFWNFSSQMLIISDFILIIFLFFI